MPVRIPSMILFAMLLASNAIAQDHPKAVIFWQPDFPTIASEAIGQPTLTTALDTMHPAFADLDTLNQPATLQDADLLVLPYGSAVPTDAWKRILPFLNRGGNLLVLGGQPLHVPVTRREGAFQAGRPQDSYAGALGLHHTYEVPVSTEATFAWKQGYAEGPTPHLKAKSFFAIEGRLDGLGYMVAPDAQLVAAPIIVQNHTTGSMVGGRFVALDFDPAPGFWATPDGLALIRRAADYASQGATTFSVEALFSTLRSGEIPTLSVHLRRAAPAPQGEVKLQLLANGQPLETTTLELHTSDPETLPIPFRKPLPPGFYQVEATWSEHGHLREFYRNGFWVSPPETLHTGPRLGVKGDTLTLDNHPFLPVGTNYFTTEENGWDFSGPRNAAVWDHDFADMQAHGVTFVRTGVWMSNARFIDGDLAGVNERFLRNLEAFLLSAQRHQIAVNFTFFAFTPNSGSQRQDTSATPPNPYLDPGVLRAEQAYVRSVVTRFHDVPFLSWDLINEPSVSNPRQIFKGNYPNDDPAERNTWHQWLREHYGQLSALADAWSVTPEDLGSFDTIPLPSIADLTYDRYGNPRQVRALDYNLFAQDVFRGWAKSMLSTIRAAGSGQLVDVGQDEGGVTDRVLNHFYASVGLSFTTNHTYWQDDALLWDSVAAKVPGTPNITGETGYQPAWAPDGAWRYDEVTGLPLMERKWVLGFAAGSTGAMQWDWAREADFGMQRSDGSAKVWEKMMGELGGFAKLAAPHATGFTLPEIAIVLPQSLQLSVLNSYALEAQQTAVRALYQQAHGAAYAVGEYQIEQIGTPKLILLPSPLGLTEKAWQAITDRVRAGAVLLVTGPFDADAHLHSTTRQDQVGLPYTTEPLTLREEKLHWPGGNDTFTFAGKTTTVLSRASLPDGMQWKEVPLGQGRILFSALPLELSQSPQALGRVYAYAMQQAGVTPLFTIAETDPGILICPTEYKNATLYVLTSETGDRQITFHDRRSNHNLSATLAAGRAAILMIGLDGNVLAGYQWRR